MKSKLLSILFGSILAASVIPLLRGQEPAKKEAPEIPVAVREAYLMAVAGKDRADKQFESTLTPQQIAFKAQIAAADQELSVAVQSLIQFCGNKATVQFDPANQDRTKRLYCLPNAQPETKPSPKKP